MPSNIVSLNVELALRQHHRVLTPKQEITIALRNDYSQKTCLRRSMEFRKVAYKHRVKEDVDIAERIEQQEGKLLDV